MENLIDLHIHLDGSIPLRTARRLAKLEGLNSIDDTELRRRMTVPPDCPDLNAYLAAFAFPLKLLQTPEAVEITTYDLLTELRSEGVIYAEPRFAPSSLTTSGISQEEVVEAAIAGLQRFIRDQSEDIKVHPEHPTLRAGLILCMMRGRGEEAFRASMDTIHAAKKYLGRGVLAMDLAGAEALFPTREFAPLFSIIRGLDIPFTIHAGEADGPDSIRDAIRFGACRIGHGVRCLEDPELVELLCKKQIPLELCPTSNIQTRIFPSFDAFPLRKLLSAGLKITINTDNMTVSDTTLNNEFAKLKEACALTSNEMHMLLTNAKEAAFTHLT